MSEHIFLFDVAKERHYSDKNNLEWCNYSTLKVGQVEAIITEYEEVQSVHHAEIARLKKILEMKDSLDEFRTLEKKNEELTERVIEWMVENRNNGCINCGSKESHTDWNELEQILKGEKP